MWLLFCWINPSILYDTKSDIHHGNFLWLSSWNDFWHSSWHSIWHILLDNLCNICWGVLQHLLGHYVWLFYRGKIVTPSLAQVCLAKPRGEEKSGEKWKEEERSGEEWRGVERSAFKVPGSLLRSTAQKNLYKQKNVEGSFSHPGTPMLPHKAPLMTQHGPNMAPTWPQHGPNMAPTWAQLKPQMDPNGRTWAQPRPHVLVGGRSWTWNKTRNNPQQKKMLKDIFPTQKAP